MGSRFSVSLDDAVMYVVKSGERMKKGQGWACRGVKAKKGNEHVGRLGGCFTMACTNCRSYNGRQGRLRVAAVGTTEKTRTTTNSTEYWSTIFMLLNSKQDYRGDGVM